MRRAGLVSLTLALSLSGCPRNEPEAAPLGEDFEAGEAQLLSSVHVADPRAEDHFLSGFHGVEQRAWRWTERTFSLLLETPPPVPLHTTELEFSFTLPGVVLETVGGPITLTARVNGEALASETYEQPKEQIVYRREVPGRLLTPGEPAKIEFEFDQAMEPNERDQRELGVIAHSIALK